MGFDMDKLGAIAKTIGWGAALWAVKQLGLGDDELKVDQPAAAPQVKPDDDRRKDAIKDTMAALDDASDDIYNDDGSGGGNDDAAAAVPVPVPTEEKKHGG